MFLTGGCPLCGKQSGSLVRHHGRIVVIAETWVRRGGKPVACCTICARDGSRETSRYCRELERRAEAEARAHPPRILRPHPGRPPRPDVLATLPGPDGKIYPKKG